VGDSLFRTNIEQGLSTLEDLYSLGDASLYPLIERLHYHFHEIENNRNQASLEKKDFRHLTRLFESELNNQVKNFFRNAGAGCQVNLINGLDDASLDQLDDIVETFPLLCEATKLFQFQKTIKIWLYNDCFSVTGEIPHDLNFEELREESYKLTRKFFKKNMLFTFKVFETNEEGSFSIKFTCHLKNSENAGVLVPLDNKKTLKLSGTMESFLIPNESFSQLGNHQVFYLNKDLVVCEATAEQKSSLLTEKDWIVFHFPFLFRPLSLIIERASADEITYSSEGTKVLNFDLFSLIQS